jgi:hypothetical protein
VPPVEKGTLELNFQWKVNGGDAEIGSRYQIATGQFLALDSFRYYISDIRAITNDNQEISLKDAALFDFDKTGKTSHGGGVFESFPISPGKYKGISFKIGLPPTLNHSETSQYPENSPLHPNKKMHLNTTNGYVFASFVGKADDGVNTPIPVSYKLASDSLLVSKNYATAPSHAFTIQSKQETQFIIQVELTEVFESISPLSSPSTQTFPYNSSDFTLAKKMMNNFAFLSLFKVP